MPYVSRDADSNIIAIYASQQADATEELSPTHPAIIRFLVGKNVAPSQSRSDVDMQDMRLSDLGMIRVIEDLIDILVGKNVISIADLPEAAISRLGSRKAIRGQMEAFNNVLAETND